MQKYRVAVLRGGSDEEYDSSLRTGEHVLDALDRERYEPLDVVITQSGEWLHQGRVRAPREIIESVDLGFIALHGAYGEDGTTQRLFDTMSVPYTGSGAFASAMARNKAMTKDRLAHAGVRMPRHMVASASSQNNISGLVEAVSDLFGPRYLVKPIDGGGAVGARYAENKQMLYAALADALSQYAQVIVEEFIAGREATCGVINNFRNHRLYALPPIEIALPHGTIFFDSDTRQNGTAYAMCPSHLTHDEKKEVEELTRVAHDTLGLAQYSRADFIVAPDGVYFLEINTLPSLAPDAHIPKALDVVGCTYNQFVDHLVADALVHSR